MSPTILIRCDANTEIGSGHFFRQLALAEWAQALGATAKMLVHAPTAALREQTEAMGVALVVAPADPATDADAAFVRSAAVELGATAVVVDGYHFPPIYFETLRDDRWTLAAVDDMAHQHFPVDVLINVNIDAEQLAYDTLPGTARLLGVKYALLRRQFHLVRQRHEGAELREQVADVLVSMGGGDQTDETSKVLRGLNNAGYRGHIDVVLGSVNPNMAAVTTLADQLEAEVAVHRNVHAMAELIAGHDLAICAGGGTSWEMACLGVPMLQIVVADNQRNIASGLARRGISHCIGWREHVGPADVAAAFEAVAVGRMRRDEMRRRGMSLIDGCGAKRVAEALTAQRVDRER